MDEYFNDGFHSDVIVSTASSDEVATFVLIMQTVSSLILLMLNFVKKILSVLGLQWYSYLKIW